MSLSYCYCEFCKNGDGKLTWVDEETKTVYIRSGKWIKNKLREEAKK